MERYDDLDAEGRVFWRAIKCAAARPTIWLATWSVLTVMALAVALPWQAWLAGATANRYAPGELVKSLTATFRYDHGDALRQLDAHTAQSGAVLAFGAILLGIFAAGGWLFLLLEPDEGPRLRRFLTGGARYFWRFSRVWLISIVLLGAWHWLVYGDLFDEWVLGRWLRVPESDYSSLESLRSEWHVVALQVGRDAIYFVGFASVLTCATYARTRLAYFARFSALGAMFTALGSILRHPIKTLRPMVALWLFELVFVTVALGWAVRGIGTQFDSLSAWVVLAGLLVFGQLALLLRELLRGARYAVAVDVLRSVRPARESSPEPSTSSLGAPGGPQYPLDDELEARKEDESGFGATV